MILPRYLAALVLVPALLAPLSGQAEPLYTVTLLPYSFTAVDINNAGQIAGNASVATGMTHAVIYAGGTLTDIGTLGGNSSVAAAINEAGDVTGNAMTASGQGHAFLYQNGSMLDIGAGISPYGLNNQGDVVGSKPTASGSTGFVYRNGVVTELGNLGTGVYGVATDINDLGDIVGESTTLDEPIHPPLHPFLYRDGALFDIGTLAGEELNGAIGINNAGQIGGYSVLTGQFWHAFRYQDGVMTDAGGFEGSGPLDVSDMNEHGTLVGTGYPDGVVPFVSIGNSLVDLNALIDPALGWHIESAVAINDVGQIVGYACRDSECGTVRLDLASAVPEPSAALLLAPGMLALGLARRRQRRTQLRDAPVLQ